MYASSQPMGLTGLDLFPADNCGFEATLTTGDVYEISLSVDEDGDLTMYGDYDGTTSKYWPHPPM